MTEWQSLPIALLVFAVYCCAMCTAYHFTILGEVNAKRTLEDQIPMFTSTYLEFRELHREHERLYPLSDKRKRCNEFGLAGAALFFSASLFFMFSKYL